MWVGIFPNEIEDKQSKGKQNPIAKEVSEYLTGLAYKGLLVNKTAEKEILKTGQRVRNARSTNIALAVRDGTVIVANENAAFVKWDRYGQAKDTKPSWVSVSHLTKLEPILG